MTPCNSLHLTLFLTVAMSIIIKMGVCILLSDTEKHRNTPQFHHDGPEEYNPGVSIFKGNLIKVLVFFCYDNVTCSSRKYPYPHPHPPLRVYCFQPLLSSYNSISFLFSGISNQPSKGRLTKTTQYVKCVCQIRTVGSLQLMVTWYKITPYWRASCPLGGHPKNIQRKVKHDWLKFLSFECPSA